MDGRFYLMNFTQFETQAGHVSSAFIFSLLPIDFLLFVYFKHAYRVDEDADFGKQIARFFGMGKKTNEESGMKEDGKGKKKNR